MAFSGMINVKTGQLTLGGQFEAYKRGQLERNIQYWSTQLFQYRGSIELYNKDRLLIKYSSFQPLGRCLNGTSWCQGGLSDPCVTNCGGQLYYVRNWVSPLIYSNDSLLLFKDYSRLNGSGSFIKDTISFVTRLYDKWSVYEEHITGIKIKQ
jgi:hypothetical protein